MSDKPIVIIGAGKVGTAVGHVLEQSGLKVAAVAARTHGSLTRAQSYINGHTTTDIAEATKMGSIILITTPDDQIGPVCDELASRGAFDVDDCVFHMSGALSISVLDSARAEGAKTGSIHPMQTFADVPGAITNLPGSVFGVTAESEALAVAEDIVGALGGEVVLVADEDKAIYHAGAVAVCNYLVTLVAYAQELYASIGIPREVAIKAFMPLLHGSLDNVKRRGPIDALTGPIARGDTGTVRRHLDALAAADPKAVPLYKTLGRYTVAVALAKGGIDKTKALELRDILEGDANGK